MSLEQDGSHDVERARKVRKRRYVYAVAACASVAAAAGAYLVVTSDGSDRELESSAVIGPEGGTVRTIGLEVRAPAGAFPVPTRVTAVRDAGSAEMYNRVSRSRSPVYRIESERQPRRAVRLRFDLSKGSGAKGLVVATREQGERGWALLGGNTAAGTMTVTARHFTWFQVRQLKEDPEPIQDALGGRAQDPKCKDDPLSGRKVTVEEEQEPPRLFACALNAGDSPEIRIINNRAAGLEFDLPDGVKVVSTKGRSIAETIWEQQNLAVLSVGSYSGGRLVPGGGGEVVLSGDISSEGIEFQTTLGAASYDALLGLLEKSKAGLEVLAAGGETLECFRVAASKLPNSADSARDFLGTLRDLVSDCNQFLKPELLTKLGKALANIQLISAVWDGSKDFGTAATLRVQKVDVPLLPRAEPSGGQCPRFSVQGVPVAIMDTNMGCSEAKSLAASIVECKKTGANLSSCTQQPYSGLSCRTGTSSESGTLYDCTDGPRFVKFLAGGRGQSCEPIYAGGGILLVEITTSRRCEDARSLAVYWKQRCGERTCTTGGLTCTPRRSEGVTRVDCRAEGGYSVRFRVKLVPTMSG